MEQTLYALGYVKNAPVFFCPELPPYSLNHDLINGTDAKTGLPINNLTYGFPEALPFETKIGNFAAIPTQKIRRPETYFYIADSVYPAAMTQEYTIRHNTNWCSFRLGHGADRCNTLFLDMHVKPLNSQELKESPNWKPKFYAYFMSSGVNRFL